MLLIENVVQYWLRRGIFINGVVTHASTDFYI